MQNLSGDDQDINAIRKYAGNTALYHFLRAERQKCYLSRNIKAFLHYHKEKFVVLEDVPQGNEMTTTSPTGSRIIPAKTWDPKEILQIIDEKEFSDKNPYFRLDIKAIRDNRKSFKGATPSGTPEKPSKQPRLEETRAKCALTIWEGQGAAHLLVKETINCTIHVTPRSDNTERFAKVQLDHAFRVYCQDLAPQSGRPPPAQRYSMQITLQASDMETLWPPLDLNKVPPPDKEITVDTDGSQIRWPLLVTNYSRFPQCPSKDEEALLPLTALQDSKQLKPKLSFQIDARWEEPASAEDYYSKWAKQRKAYALKTPSTMFDQSTPPGVSSYRLRPPDLDIKTSWEIQHDKLRVSEHVFDGLLCPLCDKHGRRFGDTDSYAFHLVREHDIFKFYITTKYTPKGKIRIYVKFAIKNTYETKHDGGVDGEGENFVHHPGSSGTIETLVLKSFDTFFDLQQYLQRDKDKNWTKAKPDPRRIQSNGHGSRSGSAFDSSARASPAANADMTRPASQVPDLPQPRRKKYPVPPAPEGITLVSLRVKRPLREGELLSESDDEIDDGWLQQKQDARIENLTGFTPLQKVFIKRHDRHMLREHINSNLHYREALVRFCRLNAGWLGGKEMRRVFAKKLAALQIEGVVKIQQAVEYWKIINSHTGSSEPIEDEGLSPIPEDTMGCKPSEVVLRFLSRCAVCRKPIQSLGDIRRCANRPCLNDCHKTCCPGLFGSSDEKVSKGAFCVACIDPKEAERRMEQVRVDEAASRSVQAQEAVQHPNGGSHDPYGTGPEQRLQAPAGDTDYSENVSLELLNSFAPDHLSQLPNGKRATTPKQPMPDVIPISPYSNPSRELGDGSSFARPLVIDCEDFPVGRDRFRIQQSQMKQQSFVAPSSDDGHEGAYMQSTGVFRMDRGPPGYQLQVSQSYHGFTSAEMAGFHAAEGPRPRIPHES